MHNYPFIKFLYKRSLENNKLCGFVNDNLIEKLLQISDL